MKIRTNSPSVLDTVIRLLSQHGIAMNKTSNNEVQINSDVISEPKLRVLLQELLDNNKFNFDDDFVLVDGNSIWSYKRIIAELEKIRKAGTTNGISGYFYKFMHLNFSSAHNNMRGWMVAYPLFDDVISIFYNTEIPEWKADVILIVNNTQISKIVK